MDDLAENLDKFISKNESKKEVEFKFRDKDGDRVDLSVKTMIKYIPVAQQRTSKNKAFVFMLKNYVCKGPVSDLIYNNIVSRSKKFVKLGLTDIIIPVFCTLVINDNRYIAFKRIPSRDGKLEKIPEKSTGLKVNVMERTSVEKLAEKLPDGDIYRSVQFQRYIFALSVCYIFKVGDMGLHNTLYDNKTEKMYIIDYDATLGKDRDDEYFYCNKKVPVKYKMYEYTFKIHPVIVKLLKDIKDEFEDEERYNLCIEKLKKFSDKNISSKNDSYIFVSKHAKSKSGFKLDEIKSGLQKYIRRGMRTKAVKCAVELISLGKIGITSLCNRLCIIAAEDISIANPNLVTYTINKILTMKKNENINNKKLIQLTVLLAESEHTRVGSHINAYYKIRDNISEAESKKKMNKHVEKYIEENGDDKVNEYLMKCLGYFSYWFKQGDLCCVYYLIKITDMSFQELPERIRTKNPVRFVWSIMADKTDEFEVLYNAYWLQSEKKPYIMMYIMMKLLLDDYEYEKPKEMDINENYYDYLDKEYKLELDDYVIDMHTDKGRKEGKTRRDFIKYGSIVENEFIPNDPIFEEYRKAYNKK